MFPIAVKFENLMKWTMIFQLHCSNDNSYTNSDTVAAQKMKFSIKDFFIKCDQIQFPTDLVAFTEEILNGKSRGYKFPHYQTFKNKYEFLIFISIFILILQNKTQKTFAPIFLLAIQISNLTLASHCCLFPVLRQCK